MRTRQNRAKQLYVNLLDLGCGFSRQDNRWLVMAPSKHDRNGQPHEAAQRVVDRYQDEFAQLVPAHGVQCDAWRPPTTESIVPYEKDSRMDVVRKGVENATKDAAKPKRYGHRKPQAKPKVAPPKPGMTRAGGWVAWAVPDAYEP